MLKRIICVLFRGGHDLEVVGPYASLPNYSPDLCFKCRRCGHTFEDL